MPHLAPNKSNFMTALTALSVAGFGNYYVAYDADRLAENNIRGWAIPNPKPLSASDAASGELFEAQKEKLIATLKFRWRANIENQTVAEDFESVFETFHGVFHLIDVAGPMALDMSGFLPETTNGPQLVAALRASYSWRDEIAGWKDALQTARLALESSNLDVNSYLEGMA